MSPDLIPIAETDGTVPRSCTLPSTEQPLRVAEFDRLFAGSVHGLDRTTSTSLRLHLDASAEATARELTEREARCCSFFTFTFSSGGDGELLLDTAVPASHVEVLDALAIRASAAAGLSR